MSQSIVKGIVFGLFVLGGVGQAMAAYEGGPYSEKMAPQRLEDGHGVGNGGDSKAIEFVDQVTALAERLSQFSQDCSERLGFDLSALMLAIKQTMVQSTDDVLWLGDRRVEAINYPKAKLIVFNREDWKSNSEKWRFVLHEYLGILGIYESQQYEKSKRVLKLAEDRACLQNQIVHRWRRAIQKGPLVYFLLEEYPAIKRYNLEANEELGELLLESVASDFDVDEKYIYYSRGRQVLRSDLDGKNVQPIFSAEGTIGEIRLVGEHLAIGSRPNALLETKIYVLAKDSGMVSDKRVFRFGPLGWSYNSPRNTLYGYSMGMKPKDIFALNLDKGKILDRWDSPYDGEYSLGKRLFSSPDGQWVIDSEGHIFGAKTLHFAGSFSQPLEDIRYYENYPLTLHGRRLRVFSPDFFQVGFADLARAPQGLFVWQNSAYAFSLESFDELNMEMVSLDSFFAKVNLCLRDPGAQNFQDSQSFVDQQGLVYLALDGKPCIYRWSPESGEYLDPISASGPMKNLIYSPYHHSLFYSNESHQIQHIDLKGEALREELFFAPENEVHGLQAAGKFLYLVKSSEQGIEHMVLGPDGRKVDSHSGFNSLSTLSWDPINRWVYSLSSDKYQNFTRWTLSETGRLAEVKSVPHPDESGFLGPLRVSPRGDLIALGSGEVFYTHEMQSISHLGVTEISDILWLGNSLFYATESGDEVLVRNWSLDFMNPENHRLPGKFVGMLGLPQGGLAIVQSQGGFQFYPFGLGRN